jgi:hypothetical protein
MIYIIIYCVSLFLTVFFGILTVEGIDSKDNYIKDESQGALIKLAILPIINTIACIILLSSYLAFTLKKT